MMMDPNRFEDALYATPPLEVVEARILELLAAASAGARMTPATTYGEAVRIFDRRGGRDYRHAVKQDCDSPHQVVTLST